MATATVTAASKAGGHRAVYGPTHGLVQGGGLDDGPGAATSVMRGSQPG
ncbi:hypothetical protein [Streptomyces sp. S1A1-7]|nr:hypothetical protein [Streptomyces sp. S1A1-7]